MKRFVQGEHRTQGTLLPDHLDDYITERNPVRVVGVFVDNLDLGELEFDGINPAPTGRPSYHPAVLLKIYIYGYLNRIQSSRRLERESQRNDLLAQGSNEVRLTVFGKLMRDKTPALPLTLRDVDGYLLKENTDPDRALMPRIEGIAHVSKSYPLKSFSDGEWQSEERSRYLTEFDKDVERAKGALVEFDPEQAKQPFPKSDCTKEKETKSKHS